MKCLVIAAMSSVLALSLGCGSASSYPTATGGASGGTAGAGGDTLTHSKLSGLPEPRPCDLPVPNGDSANLRVLSWAAFSSAGSYSFDDSQPSQIEHWETLKALRVPFTFYVNPTANSFPGYDATFQEAVTLGHELGNHTMTHCNADLTNCVGALPAATAAEELSLCSDYIVKNLGQSEVWSVAYPYGDVGWKAFSEGEFLFGRSVNPGQIAPNGSTDPLLLPVFAALGGESATAFSKELDVAKKNGSWVIFLLHTLTPTSNSLYAPVPIDAITESVAYGLKDGTMWLDSVVRIGSYWLAEKLFTTAVTTAGASATNWIWTLPPHFPKGQFLRVLIDGGVLRQSGKDLPWDPHGYYEVALDVGALEWAKSP